MKHVRDGTETYINGVNISTSRERIKKALELNAHSTGNIAVGGAVQGYLQRRLPALLLPQ